MDVIALGIVNSWVPEIEVVCGKIESINHFRMGKYYTGYPGIEYCYKVNFNFKDNRQPNSKVLDIFIKKYQENTHIISRPSKLPVREGFNQQNEISFKNDYIDYVTDQGYRLIVQYYPVSIINLNKRIDRDKKIESILTI